MSSGDIKPSLRSPPHRGDLSGTLGSSGLNLLFSWIGNLLVDRITGPCSQPILKPMKLALTRTNSTRVYVGYFAGEGEGVLYDTKTCPLTDELDTEGFLANSEECRDPNCDCFALRIGNPTKDVAAARY